MEKRTGAPPLSTKSKKAIQTILFAIFSILVALGLGAIILAAMGYNVKEAYSSLLNGAFGNRNAIGVTLNYVVPLSFAALSYSIAYRCGLINLGAEGQIYMGAVCGALVGAHLNLPAPLLIPLTLLAGFIGGAVLGLLVGFLKVKFGASELITTIMLNYIVLEFVSYASNNAPFRDPTPGAAPRMTSVLDAAKLPVILPKTTLHAGIFLVLAAAIIYYFFMWRTTKGYEMRVIGQNPNAGRYSGMNIRTNSILAFSIAGGFAGLGGIIHIMGLSYYVTSGFASGFGFSGIAVALLGNTHPAGVLLSAVLFGGLSAGGYKMQQFASVPAAAIYMIQGLIILFAVSRELFAWLKRLGKLPKMLGGKKKEEV